MARILVTGSSSGLGKEIVKVLEQYGHHVIGYDITNGEDVTNPHPAVFEWIEQDVEGLDILVNCAGINGIDHLEDLTPEKFQRIMAVNAEGIYRMSKACLPMLIASKGTILNIVSNAAHMPMTASLAYNASKGAALIMTKQLARELGRRHGITVFSVSPNKLAGTAMSEQIDQEVVRTRGWTLEKARQYQLAGLLTGEETPPAHVADFIGFLLSDKERHRYLAGCDIPYGL